MSPGAHHDELSAEDRAGHFAAKYNLSDDVRKELQKEMSAIERDSSKEQAHHGHHDEPPTMQIFKATIQRQQWGEPEPELHADFTSLFLDLVYVGVAFSIGHVMKYSFYSCTLPHDAAGGSGSASASASGSVTGRMLGSTSGECVFLAQGMLHVFVYFAALFNHWLIDALWDAHYEMQGLYQWVFEFFNLLFVVQAASAIDTVHHSRTNPINWFWFITFNFAAMALWATRYAIVALFSEGVHMRREGRFKLTTMVMELVLMAIAAVFVRGPDEEFLGGSTAALFAGSYASYDLCLFLLLLSPCIWPLRLVLRAIWPCRGPGYNVEEYTTPRNVPFFIHRCHEFIMLMIGEGVMQVCGPARLKPSTTPSVPCLPLIS